GFRSREFSAKIARYFTRFADGLDRTIDPASDVRVTQVIEHHSGARNGADRIGDPAARLVRRAAMHRFEKRDAVRMNIGGGGHPEPALERGPEVGENVTEHIIGYNHFVLSWIENHQHRHGVYILSASFDLRIFRRNDLENSPPEIMPVGQNVRLIG